MVIVVTLILMFMLKLMNRHSLIRIIIGLEKMLICNPIYSMNRPLNYQILD